MAIRGTFKCIDAHTCGNPVRLVVEGGPQLRGANMSEKRQDFLEQYDWIRRGLMFEPRGHDMMSGSILYPPSDVNNDIGVLFIETSGCLPMCGHGTIGTVTIAIEEGLVQPKKPGFLRLETPAGLVEVSYKQTNGQVDWVKFLNVESYLAGQELNIDSASLGSLQFDVAYGGNFYAIVDAQENFSDIRDYSAADLIRFSQEIRDKINLKYKDQFIHPLDSSIKNVSHVLWTGAPISGESTARNAVFYGDKAIDRSPCGTGTSARMAQWCMQGRLEVGDEFIHESYIGSSFIGRVEEKTELAGLQAIRPSIQGWAKIYGHNTITIDDDDPYAFGFQVV
ncbi:4-hydroxyproline epimerase [Muriicola sp. Z0-33]|uniref:4-hydroxyproline epimerase n=1 Tax=Muriicola sp. Z0-33 TaxID=2816957 RepID=UPI0022372310|nr:4-hydroxyproline epimerase [Muriicola sp. Z0-33]MCW5515502.1 4-hydroxyproline epimerase [Muriicola sp. Z0-33]